MGHQKFKHYSEAFRLKVVKDVLINGISKDAAMRKYSIRGGSQVLDWMRNYERYGVCALNLARVHQPLMPHKINKDTDPDKAALQTKIKQLERRLEDESLLREMYGRMIEIAEKEYKITIRKKSNTK